MAVETVDPPSVGPTEILVRVRATGINPVETYIRSGKYPVLPTLPYTPGADAAGVVEQIGESVSGVWIGQRVYTAGSVSGTYAELALCRREQVHPLPDNVSFEQGAGINIPYATAYRALAIKAQAKRGESVLVHGASGGVGIAAIQIARSLGLKVFGTAGSERGRELVKLQGADEVLDHGEPGYLDSVKTLTEGRGIDLIIEMLANVNLSKDLTILAVGGRVVVVGSRGSVEINPRDAMARDATILGMMLAHASADELREIHATIGRGLSNDSLKPIVGHRFPLGEAAQAHRAVMEPGAYGKIVLVP